MLLARILPLSLRLKEHAAIYSIKRGGPLQYLPGREFEVRESPFSLPHPADRRLLQFGVLASQEDVDALGTGSPILFTDGSKLEGRVGASVTCWMNGDEFRYISFRLENYCSVFQAELSAILRAVQWMETRNEVEFIVASDSRSGLEIICDTDTVHPIAFSIRASLRELHNKGVNVKLFWVKAHIGIIGNERADELAKRAALHNKQVAWYDKFPLSYAKHIIRNATVQVWQDRYMAASAGGTTKLFFRDVALAYRVLREIRLNNFLTQIFTGHGGFRAYLYKFKLADSPLCTCGSDEPQTVLHILFYCSKFVRLRFDCECAMDIDIVVDNLGYILATVNTRELFLVYARAILRRVGLENGSFLEPI